MDFPPVVDASRMQRVTPAGPSGPPPMLVNLGVMLVIALFVFILWRRFVSKQKNKALK